MGCSGTPFFMVNQIRVFVGMVEVKMTKYEMVNN